MKSIKSYIIILAACLPLLTSCSDFLDKEPDTELDMENVFNDKTHVEQWLANVYSAIPDCYDGSSSTWAG